MRYKQKRKDTEKEIARERFLSPFAKILANNHLYLLRVCVGFATRRRCWLYLQNGQKTMPWRRKTFVDACRGRNTKNLALQFFLQLKIDINFCDFYLCKIICIVWLFKQNTKISYLRGHSLKSFPSVRKEWWYILLYLILAPVVCKIIIINAGNCEN